MSANFQKPENEWRSAYWIQPKLELQGAETPGMQMAKMK